MKLKEAGVIWTFPKKCFPLQQIDIIFEWNKLNGQNVHFEIFDGNHDVYLKKDVKSKKGKAEISILAGNTPGVHYIKAETYLPDNTKYVRYGSFLLEIKTTISVDDKQIEDLFKLLEDAINLSIDIVKVNGKAITYYKTGDNSWENLAYPSHGISGMKYFIKDIKSMFEVLYENQWPDGKLPDHIYGDGNTDWKLRKLRSIMADLETSSVANIYESWIANGDDEWLKNLLPKIEASLFYATENPIMFDKKYNLIKRPHTCDMWDVQILVDDSCAITSDSRFVCMQGDTSAMFQACDVLSKIYKTFGNKKRANFWEYQKKYYYEKGNKIFWDGKKYIHHIHLDPVDHKDFKEEQLTMSNVYAIRRGFADHRKSVSIIKEYFDRLKKTKSKFPWWSLQPGYPDKLNYFKKTIPWSKKEGEYCNGGLFPLVGGELTKACFQHGFEKLGFKMLYDFYAHIKKYNGAVFTWYYSDGTPGINSPHHQTNYDMWGISPWTQSLIEEVAGIQSTGKTFKDVLCSPKWSASDIKDAYAIAHFPSSNTYFAYKYTLLNDRIEILFTGTGEKVNFHILLPEKKHCKECLSNEKKIKFDIEKIESSLYVNFEHDFNGIEEVKILF
mgnify:CR=1 FL=1